jgi:hypothetical protein
VAKSASAMRESSAARTITGAPRPARWYGVSVTPSHTVARTTVEEWSGLLDGGTADEVGMDGFGKVVRQSC